MKLLLSETVEGVGRVEAIVDDEEFTIVRFWQPGNAGRPDSTIELSPRMDGGATEKLMAQYAGALSGAKLPGTDN